MCGIIGIASNKPVSINIINSLKKLEYRGYDSAGIATLKNNFINAAAVIAVADEKWGEVPCAFIEVKPNVQFEVEQAKLWCNDNLASFKIPKYYFFEQIPRTSTGKIQKFILREKAKKLIKI